MSDRNHPLKWCHIQEEWKPQSGSCSTDQNDEEGKEHDNKTKNEYESVRAQ
jgi:hypothetical protein